MSQKSAKKRFFYSHEYRDQKWGEKTRGTISPETPIMREKYVGEKNRWKKVRKHVFYIHTNIVTKKWGEKNARNNFSRNTQIVREKTVRKKIVGKNFEKTFFKLTRIS